MKRVIVVSMAVVAMGLACLISTVGAQSEKVKATDQKFVQKASIDGKAEVQLGKLATEQAASTDVKQFGKRMVTDHTKANEELMTITQAKNIEVPTKADAQHQKTAEKLGKLHGASFDREYMRHMVTAHEQAVQLFSKEAQQGKNADLKAFAAKTLPTLEEHLRMARNLAQQQRMSQAR